MIKLHIGCGWNVLPGWINVDVRPRNHEVIQVDATKGLPFPDGIVDYVFHEHVIEHLDRADGITLLAECLRVLRPGGKIRVVAPDLNFLWKLMHEPTDLSRAYVEGAVTRWLPAEPAPHPALVVNNFFYNFNHRFLYDLDLLWRTMEQVGFTHLAEGKVGSSDDPALDDLEHTGRMPDGWLALESMVIEASRPE